MVRFRLIHRRAVGFGQYGQTNVGTIQCDAAMPQLSQAQNNSVKIITDPLSLFQCVIWILIAGFVPQWDK